MPKTSPVNTVAGLTAIIEFLPTAIVMVVGEGNIVLVNAEAERLFGYSRDQLLGEPIETLVPYRFRAGHLSHSGGFFKHPSARQMGAGRDLYGLRKDGTEFPVDIGLNPITTEEGMFVVSAIADTTERTRQTEALRQANAALERSNIDLQRFAHVASHDLQTPMRHIASFVGLLRSTYGGKLDEQADDWLRRTAQSVAHLQTLIRDLLEYSRVDFHVHPFEPIPMHEVFDSAVMLLETSIGAAGALVTRGELPSVMGDRSQLVQLMVNLIGNAIKYRDERPPLIHVSAEHKGNEWIVAVRDNAMGIAPQHHERIFEIFQRLHDQSKYPGTGIGLAVCRRVVHRHGGRIWVESEPGSGSVFYFTISRTTPSLE